MGGGRGGQDCVRANVCRLYVEEVLGGCAAARKTGRAHWSTLKLFPSFSCTTTERRSGPRHAAGGDLRGVKVSYTLPSLTSKRGGRRGRSGSSLPKSPPKWGRSLPAHRAQHLRASRLLGKRPNAPGGYSAGDDHTEGCPRRAPSAVSAATPTDQEGALGGGRCSAASETGPYAGTPRGQGSAGEKAQPRSGLESLLAGATLRAAGRTLRMGRPLTTTAVRGAPYPLAAPPARFANTRCA